MARSYLLIDGYNLLHAAGMARRKYGPQQLQRCRSQLLRYLARHLTAPERERTTVVFDAASAPPGLERRTHYQEISVYFASPGKDADDTIEELIAAHSSPRQIRLVSSDHRLQRSVRKRKGTFLDSDDFVQELEQRGPVTEAPDSPDEAPAEEAALKAQNAELDTEAWLRIFGDSPDAAELGADLGYPDPSIDQADVAAIQEEIDRQEASSRPRVTKRRKKNT